MPTGTAYLCCPEAAEHRTAALILDVDPTTLNAARPGAAASWPTPRPPARSARSS
ncbi:hypothetical protein [Micromonospora sp. NBC_00389]|uniref:hypothetical protein n=1 Tax=Micromonospora sp. NBC_00389 TaxID=2903586 RepID=UPI003FA560E9